MHITLVNSPWHNHRCQLHRVVEHVQVSPPRSCGKRNASSRKPRRRSCRSSSKRRAARESLFVSWTSSPKVREAESVSLRAAAIASRLRMFLAVRCKCELPGLQQVHTADECCLRRFATSAATVNRPRSPSSPWPLLVPFVCTTTLFQAISTL